MEEPWEHLPTALIANNFKRGFWGLRISATGMYSWIKQYMAIVTDRETIMVI